MNIDPVIMFTFASDEQIHRIMNLVPNGERPFDISSYISVCLFQFV